MRTAITGGSGFIGSYVTPRLGWLINLDLKAYTDLFKEKTLPKDIDVIIHLAAQLEILGVDPIKELRNNVQATVHMLELARKFDVPKFVFTSSADIYGEPPTLGKAVGASKETDPPKPFWSYAASKVAAEAYVQQYEELYGIKTVIIRPSIVTGRREWYGRFVTLSMARLLEGKPIEIFGQGNQTRDFVPVETVAEIILKATTMDIKTPEIFNAGTMGGTSIYMMAQKIISSAVELGIKRVYPTVNFSNPLTGQMGRKPHEQINQLLDMTHTNQVLGPLTPSNIDLVLTNELFWLRNMKEEQDGFWYKKWKRKPRY